MSFRTNNYKDVNKWREVRNAAKRRYAKRTGSGEYPPKPYTLKEDELILAHSIPDRELASKLERSVSAIQKRRYVLKKD